MNVGKAVYGILSSTSAVTDIVSTNIFPEIAEQETATPFIVYQLQGVAPEDTHDGPSKLDEVRMEIICFSDSYNGAADLADKVRGALDRVSGTYNGVNVESVQFNNVDIEIEYDPRRYSQVTTYTFRIKRDNVTIPQGPPVTVTDGDGSTHIVDAGGAYTCLPATARVGIHYQRVIPWDQNDSGLASYVTAQRAAGAYNYTPPTNPATIAMLDNAYTGTDIGARLADNNRFGNKFRFTNDVGEQYTEGFAENVNNTSSNPRYCIDHLSRLAWYVQDAYNDVVDRTPAQASVYVASFSYAGYSDWRLADAAEYLNAALYADFNNSYTGSYTPFVDDLMRSYGGQLWYGTFTKDDKYLQLVSNGNPLQERTATNTAHHVLMVRNHFT